MSEVASEALRAPFILALDDLTPSQQLALLIVTNTDASRVIARHLERTSTVRTGPADFAHLVTLGLAQRTRTGFHNRTPRGLYTGSILTRTLAERFGLSGMIMRTYLSRGQRGGYQRSICISQSTW